MKNKPILSICIPTYNRATFLPVCLQSIVEQFKNPEFLEKVEVVVADNGSSDNTTEVVKNFTTKFFNISYFKHQNNLGYDRNALFLVSKAQGNYVWIIGDDDAYFNYAFAHILPILETGKYGYLLANCQGYDKDLNLPALSKPNLHILENKEYSSLRDFVSTISNYTDTVGYFGGVSCQIFKKEIWDNFQNKEKYIGTQTVHLFIILEAYENLKTLVIARPLVKIRADSIRWDTFPGLETAVKRASSTKNTMVWIFKQYRIPYSKTKLWSRFYLGILYSWILYLAKKTFLKNKNIKSMLKKLLGK
jgi:abequosyltransferase